MHKISGSYSLPFHIALNTRKIFLSAITSLACTLLKSCIFKKKKNNEENLSIILHILIKRQNLLNEYSLLGHIQLKKSLYTQNTTSLSD